MADLVSVLILTFNSEETIERALDSVAAQTYRPIELVVADDASQDGTLATCVRWLDAHKGRFEGVKVIRGPVNRGITHNIAAGVDASEGTWIKPLAGDDELTRGTIERFVEYAHSHPEAHFMVGGVETVMNGQQIFWPKGDEFHTRLQVQRRLVLSSCYCPHIGMFYSKKGIAQIDGFDFRYQMLEDHPLLLRIANKGFPIHFVSGIAARHFITMKSVTRSHKLGRYQHPALTRDSLRFFREELSWRQRQENMIRLWLVFSIKIFLECHILPQVWNVPLIGPMAGRVRSVIKREQFRLRRAIVLGKY